MVNINNIVITNIDEIFTVLSPKNRTAKISKRKSYALSFCIDGQITYIHNNNEIVSDKNHAVILPKGQSYTLHGDKTGSFPVINFQCAEPLCDTIVSIPIQNPNLYIKDFEQIKALSLFKDNRNKMMSIFYDMLHRLSSQNTNNSVISRAIAYLENNYDNPGLTNAELAKQCNISEVYFRRIFEKQYKMTPKQYIVNVRINKAKQLLVENSLKINAVAEHCGFSNQYHFCRVFKKKTGLTPTEYIKQNKIYKI